MNEESFFKAALKESVKASLKDEVPIGAVLVKNGKIIVKAYNQTEAKQDFTAHAELLCLQKASKKLKTKYLTGCKIYVTLEPCKMCCGAAQLSRVDSIHYVLPSQKFGKKGKAYSKIRISKKKSAFSDQSLKILREFFKKKR